MGPIEAVSTCLRKFVTFSGRARRPEYWWWVLATTIVSIVASVLDRALGIGTADGGPIGGIVSLLVLLPSLAAGWRRLHDVDRPGWLLLLPALGAIPLLAGTLVLATMTPDSGLAGTVLMGFGVLLSVGLTVYLFILMVSRGTSGPNRFGPEPPIA